MACANSPRWLSNAWYGLERFSPLAASRPSSEVGFHVPD